MSRSSGLSPASPVAITGSSRAGETTAQGLANVAAERQLQLGLACEACAGEWTLAFDSGAFLWEEIEARAMALLDDVHRLALAYGWSEQAILSMNESRRAAYLERLH